MVKKYSALIASVDQAAIEEMQMFLPIFLNKAEESRRHERSAAAGNVTARMIYNDFKEAMALIIYRVSSPHSVLKQDRHKLTYVKMASDDILRRTLDDCGHPRIIGMINALRTINSIARVQYEHFKGNEAEAFPFILGIAQDALKGIYPTGYKHQDKGS